MIKVWIDDTSEGYDVYATEEECCYIATSKLVDDEVAKRWIETTQKYLAMCKEIEDIL